MSEPERPNAGPEDEMLDNPSPGPNLKLIYSLIALALLLAIGFAAMIVWPFYARR